ncbi:MAG: glucosidase [Candidatus Competibacter sp.]
MIQGKEAERLRQAYAEEPRWMLWGPYLSERQWGTVREDYSEDGNAWDYFPHDHARSRAYRWGEDGLAGISDDEQRLCFALALWNGKDPILKERLFGLTNGEGNHGEDVKEYYYYLDNTPTHSYMKWLYKYPQAPFPYDALVAESRRRKQTDSHASEFELIETGVFADDRYFDVQVEYAKASPQDLLIKIQITNRGPSAAKLDVLPTLWFRNTWSWFHDAERPRLQGQPTGGPQGIAAIRATPDSSDDDVSPMMLYCLRPDELLFVENETNGVRLWGGSPQTPYPKDGINDHVVLGRDTVNPALIGTKASAAYHLEIEPQETKTVRLRLSSILEHADPFGPDFEATFQARLQDADQFYASLGPEGLTDDRRAIQRQAYAGMLWSKQYYYYHVRDWLKGDPVGPPPPAGRSRNSAWTHFYASNVLSMPDKWEYPWFASWDLCFQSVVFARLDLQFAKNQLLTLAREFYMSPAGAVPAYEWAFSDVNPPLHAWAALRIHEIEKEVSGDSGDSEFLAQIFGYCLMYFTWWTNRKDSDQKGLFEGGFLGLDNISLLDRSHLGEFEAQLGKKLELYQSDGTSWMGMFSLHLMEMALELSRQGQTEYARLATKFFQNFVLIAEAMNSIEYRSQGQVKLWDDEDGFFYDVLRVSGNPDRYFSIRLRSLVGILALFPVAAVDFGQLDNDCIHGLRAQAKWFRDNHPEFLEQVLTTHADEKERHLLSFVKPDRLKTILKRVFDETEFLSPHGIRGISQAYRDTPCSLTVDGVTATARYEPAESSVGLFGGNSNWRGPVWFPINFLLIDTLRRYHEFLGDDFQVEYPTRSGQQRDLGQIADDLSRRLVGIFERGADGKRPVYGGDATFQSDPNWRDLILFFEYFHGDNGSGIGASHQTGWTGLVAELLHRS